MSRRLALAAAPVLVAVLVLPWNAQAAVVQLRLLGTDAAELRVIALPGEENQLEVSQAAGGDLTVTDPGAPLYAGEHCVKAGSAVTCAPGAPDLRLSLSIATSDGDDRIVLSGISKYANSYVQGGGGDDVVLGGVGGDELIGNAGDDDIRGAGGRDQLWGSAGSDSLIGGPGTDTATYQDHDAGVTVTIDDRAGDGGVGERDNVHTDVENLTGSRSADRLTGSDARNRIDGGEGDDVIAGGAGNDTLIAAYLTNGRLVGGPGRDRLTAATGSTVDARDGEVDTVQCPNFLTRPPLADASDVLRRCVPLAFVRGSSAHVTAAGRVELRVRCRAIDQPCLLNVELRHRGRRLGHAVLRIEEPRAVAWLALNARGRRLVASHRKLRVRKRTQVFRAEPAPSSTPVISEPFVLRRAP